jgi:hypothetical protein
VRPERPGRLDVVVLTDLQRLSWLAAGDSLGALFAGVFEQGGGTRASCRPWPRSARR